MVLLKPTAIKNATMATMLMVMVVQINVLKKNVEMVGSILGRIVKMVI